ncbi:hypothetical protein [Adhaeribacter aquaticus]|uniref:hypothetical protein n=1 Tax=Adhaeribacter aquaticus TaxID=299567 RepID=UPI0003F5AB40|nr:hypothetical protein [Adhaeribacter aquaticus]
MYAKERDFRYYLDNKDRFSRRYPNQYILIKAGALIGAFDSYILAEEIARRLYQENEYYIQHCHSKE